MAQEPFVIIDSSDKEEQPNAKVLKQWLGTHKTIPSNDSQLPADVRLYIRRLQKIPSHIQQKLPVLSAPVLDGLVLPHIPLWFSCELPNYTDSFTIPTSIPPKEIVQSLRKEVNQAVIDRKEAITDPNDMMRRFPLYIIEIWWYLHMSIECQKSWSDVIDWLHREAVREADISRTLAIMLSLQKLDLTYASSNGMTSDLSRLLGDRWLNSNMIDILLGLVSDRIEQDQELDSKIVVESLRLMEPLVEGLESKKQRSVAELSDHSSLRRIKERVVDKEVVYCPVHWQKKKHWIALKISLTEKVSPSITYANGIEGNPWPQSILRCLKCWLEYQFADKKFALLTNGNVLVHGVQDDFVNCGFICVNAIEHAVFPDAPLWTAEKKTEHHVSTFNRVAGLILSKMNIDVPEVPMHGLGTMRIDNLLNDPQSVTTEDPEFEHSTFAELAPGSKLHITSLLNPHSNSYSDPLYRPRIDILLLLNGPEPTICATKTPQTSVNAMLMSGFEEPVSPTTDQAVSSKRQRNMCKSESDEDVPSRDYIEYESDSLSEATVHTEDLFFGSDSELYPDSAPAALSSSMSEPSRRLTGVAKSSAWAHQQNLNWATDPSCKNREGRAHMRKFISCVRRIDPHARVINGKEVIHSWCGKTQKLGAPFQLGNFLKHTKHYCNGRGDVVKNNQDIKKFFQPISKRTSGSPSSHKPSPQPSTNADEPCPGLTSDDHPLTADTVKPL
ncbi:hypothetical protein EV360DRAFT_89654 [Lentinula raphanica]|nr:hypothetical protein EV360DRAFT_89654 [Lentinula raphanica]